MRIEKMPKRGFKITSGGNPCVSTHPYIPKWYFKPLYPFILVHSARICARYARYVQPPIRHYFKNTWPSDW
jgi:hypothetical protein